MRKAIFFSNIFYESPIQIGDHQLARQFARDGWQVAFISVPLTPLHIFSKERRLISQRFHNFSACGADYTIGSGSIWSYVPGAWLTPRNVPVLNAPQFYRNWQNWSLPGLLPELKRRGFAQADMIYFREPLFAGFIDRIPASRTVYRIADHDRGFKQFSPGLAANERRLAGAADLTVYTAHELEQYVAQLNPQRSLYLPNGVDYDFFQSGPYAPPPDLQAIKPPYVVYVGSIEPWLDIALLRQLATALPQVNFVLIGPGRLPADNQPPNLINLGARPHTQIPAYLTQACAGIIPFDLSYNAAFIHAINPIKLYEYMACGLPVVATRWRELENIQSPAILCERPDDFVRALQNILSSQPDSAALRDFARQHDWEARYRQLTAALDLPAEGSISS